MTASPTRARLIGAGLLLGAFGTGIAAGLVADRMPGARRGMQVRLEARTGGVLNKLGLTEEQRRRAEAILGRGAPRTRAVMLEAGERLQLIADSVDAELRAILTAEQRIRLDSLGVGQRLLLKRKVVQPDGGVVTDTVFPRRDTARTP